MPLPGLELAASRTIQWGGSGRPESLRSLAQGAGRPRQRDARRAEDEAGRATSSAGFDARYTLALGERRTLSIYGQAIGEDEAGSLPSHYLGEHRHRRRLRRRCDDGASLRRARRHDA